MSDCKFCALLNSGPLAASLSNLVVETDRAVVAVNRKPVAPGHLTVILKRHHARTSDLQDDDLGGVGRLLGRLSRLLEERFHPGRVVFLGDGKRSAHVHWHLIPEPTGVTLDLGAAVADLNLASRPATLTEPEVQVLVGALRQALAKAP